MLSEFSQNLLIIFMFHLPALLVPGPNLLVLIKSSMSLGFKASCFTAFGICCGILIHIIYSLVGCSNISLEIISNLQFLKYVTAAYLFYIAWLGLQNANQMSTRKYYQHSDVSLACKNYFQSFKLGFFIDCFNPMIGAFYFVLWTMLISKHDSLLNVSFYAAFSIFIPFSWFILISFFCSRKNFRKLYLKFQVSVEKAASVMLYFFANILLIG